MKTVLVAVNAQYIHTSLAVRSIAACLRSQKAGQVEICEFTINQPLALALEELVACKADVYLFSCYIWNVDFVATLAEDLRRLLPKAHIAAGGPQAAYAAEEFLQTHLAFEAVLCGEGEVVCGPYLRALDEDEEPYLSGVVYRGQSGIKKGPPAPLAELDVLPFAYEDLGALQGKIMYYESMRGCPYRCSYCLSAAQQGLRFKALPKVFEELDRLLAAAPAQVKFVDRTFNCDKARALEIWRYLARRDNGTTNFHFEMAGDVFDEKSLVFLAGVRPGLFQFEIGVQSTNEETLLAIHRNAKLKILFDNVKRLQAGGNIHLHLDLIAGLPHEDLESLAVSFNRVYEARPEQLQLGTLKVLDGTEMQCAAGEYGIVCSAHAPFEVLRTNWLGYEEVCEVKRIAHMVDAYYNSGRFVHIIEHMCAQFATPFAFYQRLAEFYQNKGHPAAPLSKVGHYDLLAAFMKSQGLPLNERAQWLCRYDLLLHEKPRAVPQWVQVDGAQPYGLEVLEFYKKEENIRRYLPQYEDCEPKQIRRMAHIEVFPFDPDTGEEGNCALLFDYTRRDIRGWAKAWRIHLSTTE